MRKDRPCVLSIAGFDPSGGAGLLADIKTFEQEKVLGMGVMTGLTFQNDSEFVGVHWTESSDLLKQIEVLCRKFRFEFVKIGMVSGLDMIESIMKAVCQHSDDTKFIWDPIIKTSSGFDIHRSFQKDQLASVLSRLYLVTPNIDEAKLLAGNNDEMAGAKMLSGSCNVLLKGGHNEKSKGKDFLFTKEGKVFSFNPKNIAKSGKHGSGCVLSASLTANLANGLSLHRSCLKAKDYVTKVLSSNKNLLGYHKI